MLKGWLNVCPLLVYFTLVHSTPSITLPYPFISHPQFFNSFQCKSLCPLPLQLMLCDIIDALLFSFNFSFPMFKSSSSIISMFYIWRMIWSSFLKVYIFCVYLYLWICSHMRENMWLLCFWAWLTSLSMMSSNCIPLPSTTCHYSLCLINSPLCIYTTFSWSIHQL
jgi:hypothetical protein